MVIIILRSEILHIHLILNLPVMKCNMFDMKNAITKAIQKLF